MTKDTRRIETNNLSVDMPGVNFEPLAGSFNFEQYLTNISNGIKIVTNGSNADQIKNIDEYSGEFKGAWTYFSDNKYF